LMSTTDTSSSVAQRSTPFIAGRPVVGTAPTKSGPQEIPFRAYNADALIIGCWADGPATEAALGAFPYPVAKNSRGQALIFLYVMNYHDSTCGPYRELVVVITLVKSPSAPPLANDAIPLVASTLLRDDIKHCVWRLWLSHQSPIDYGRDILGYDKYNSNWTYSGDLSACNWEVAGVAKGSYRRDGLMTRLSNVSSLAWHLGLAGLSKASGPIASEMTGIKGVLPHFDGVPEGKAEMLVQPDIALWNSTTQSLVVEDEALRKLKLEPIVCQRAVGAQAVFFAPHNVPVRKAD